MCVCVRTTRSLCMYRYQQPHSPIQNAHVIQLSPAEQTPHRYFRSAADLFRPNGLMVDG